MRTVSTIEKGGEKGGTIMKTRSSVTRLLVACVAVAPALGFQQGPLCPASSNVLRHWRPGAKPRAMRTAPPPRMVCGRRSAAALAAALPASLPLPTSLAGVGFGVNTVLGLAGAATGAYSKMLTPSGLLHSWALGVILWSSFGWQGWSLCVVYLLAGSRVTKVKMQDKVALGIGEGRGGKRGPENVWGSAATGALCALAALRWPAHAAVLRLGYVASIATKLSDTFASEIGKAYGYNCFLITTLKPVPRGTEGAVSVEGTLAGVGGSLIIAAYGALVGLIGRDWRSVALVAAAAFVGTTAESYIGAIAQDKVKLLTNEVVNFLNTLIGAAFAVGVSASGVW